MKSGNSVLNVLLQIRKLGFVSACSFKLDGARFYFEVELWSDHISEDQTTSLLSVIRSFGFICADPCFYDHDFLSCLCLLIRIDAYKDHSFNADIFDE